MQIHIDDVVRHMLAHSAAAAILGDTLPRGPLRADHQRMMECLVREAFCRVCMALAPALESVDPAALSLTFAAAEPPEAAAQLTWILAARALETALAAAGSDTAGHYGLIADQATERLWRLAGGYRTPPALRGARY